MLLFDVAMEHNYVYILLADAYDYFIKISYNVTILTLSTFTYYWNELHVLTSSYNIKGPMGRTTLIFHTTTVPNFQDFSPEVFHGGEKGEQ